MATPGRGLSAGIVTALGNANVEFYHLVRLDFSTPLYYTTAPYDISYGGNIYISNSILSKIPNFTESLKIKPNTISLTVGGADINMHALMLGDYVGVDAYIYVYIPSLSDAFLKWQGVVDKPSSTENVKTGASTITWSIANHWSNWEAKNSRLLNNDDQQRFFPTDDGLEFVGITAFITQWWGGYTYRVGQVTFTDTGGYRDQSQFFYYGSPSVRTFYNAEDYNQLDFERSALPVVYGETIVQGLPVFRDITNTLWTYDSLHVVYALAEGECDSLVDITFFEDGVSYTHASLSPYISVTFHSGTNSQAADAGLVAASSHWTTTHKLSGICYVYIKYTANKNAWRGSGEPIPTFKLKGKKLYDPRDTTTSYSTNPALVLYDYATSVTYGKGLAAAQLDGIEEAADYCDVQLMNHSNVPTQSLINRFDFRGTINTGETIKKNVELILFTMLGHMTWSNGFYQLIIERDDDTTAYSFDEDNIRGTFTVDYDKKYNIIYYKYVDLALENSEGTIVAEDAAYLTADNDRELKQTLANPFEHDIYRATNRSETMLKRSRQNLFSKLDASNMDAMQVIPGDVIDITRGSQGWVNKLFRIEEMTLLADGSVTFGKLKEYESSVYDWAIGTEYTPPANTTLADPLTVAAPTTLVLASGSTNQIVTDDGSANCRIKVSFTASTTDTVEYYICEYQEFSDTDWTRLPDLIGRAANVFYIDNVITDVAYTVRVIAVNGTGIQSSALSASHTVLGVTILGRDTEALMTDGFSNTSIYTRLLFESLDNANTSGGTTVGGVGNSGLIINSTSQTISIYLRTMRSTINNSSSWAKNRRLKMDVNISGISNLALADRAWINLGDFGVNPNENAVGVRYAKNATSGIDVYGWTALSGVTATNTETFIVNIPDGTQHVVRALWIAATSFYIEIDDGTTTTGITMTTTLPSGSNGTDQVMYAFAPQVNGMVMTVEEYIFLQES